ncbi:alpha-amylase family protein [Bradyrhizobium mercantei]|uniref:alpha-amylase family protein n=1 Tax=Bradyrhizobium mercantei TaxID=1904807 RepID=UPI00097675D0|nr:alpha-amylase family protein [Bradyrhizobium mercantei]
MGSWIEHAIWWHVYPLGFVGAEREAHAFDGVTHRFSHLTAWLDHVITLGASGILLGPVFASSTHGYDTVDYFRIDPRLGDDADLEAFVDAARRRGLRIVLDGVFNHVGHEFPIFRRALAGGATSREARWFRLTWPSGDGSGGPPDYATFEGHRHLVKLNHDEPEVVDYVTRIMVHWLARGVSGWRLDAAYAVPAAFWRKVLPQVRAGYPDAYIFGEVIHGDYAGFVREAGLDSVTQYELWKAVWSSLNDRNLFELAWALKRHNGMLETFAPQTFIGNHDVTRIASQLQDELHLAHALVILMTVGGLPSVYAGDELGYRGVKEHRAGGDDAIRPLFPATPPDPQSCDRDTLRLHQQLVALRRRNPWLHRARSKVLELQSTSLLFMVFHDEHRLWVVLNLADAHITRVVDASVNCIAGNSVASRRGTTTEIAVPSHGWSILSE